ncbi:P-loop containing nucleoside triphosphate hydrolase protein [Dactylonectria estremocensis]|uniref:P-loop containing nucleoside triphosphate hydrolase protein n=1 Tax=Dactylonectria estremocensis TaxID=1079267 RepID=A0A9P9J966_9HYPO|nr:P-loop containing nucleoside triphosphate hydrolase protein [Dactylonectria estremocensis]
MEDYDFSSEGIILVLGVTGAGKSYFLNQLKSHSVEEGHSLRSETTQCNAVQIFLDYEEKRSITVVDTPGFDDTTRPHGEVLAEITEFLAAQHTLGVPLRGLLYLHKITDNRMTGSSITYLRLLESLVGDHALENLILVTTMWNKLRDEDRGQALRHEQELLDDYWGPMEEKGSYVAQFDGTPDSAYALIFQLAGKDSVVLDVQKEIMDEDRTVITTSAGKDLMRQLEEDREAYRLRAAKLGSQLRRESDAEPRNKDLIRQLREEKAHVESVLRQMDQSVDQMKTRPGSPIRQRIKRALRDSNRAAIGGAAAVLAAVLNLTVFVVQLGLGGA